MRKRWIATATFAGLLSAGFSACGDTPLTITSQNSACWDDQVLYLNPPAIDSTFVLNGVVGTGVFQSSMPGGPVIVSGPPKYGSFFNYTLDLSGLSPAANHCIRLVIHFGTPEGCTLGSVFGNPADFTSATLAPFGDITFVFAGGCLSPGHPPVSLRMISEAPPTTNYVTIIDDYSDPASGQTNELRLHVRAVVPGVPPNWLYAPAPIPNITFQGTLTFPTNFYQPPTNAYVTAPYDFAIQLLNAPSNGFSSSQIFTQTVQV